MSTPYEARGRVRQKRRTRAALVSAARDLVAQGVTPTVEEAAVAAGVSRTTAYRYFANQGDLLAAAHPEVGATTMLDPATSDDPAERLAAVVDRFINATLETEQQQRTMLRLSLEPDRPPGPLPLRQGRSIGWFTEALEPLASHVGEDQLRRLVLAIRGTVGIEVLTWLTDVAGLSRAEATQIMRWSAQALLRDVLADAGSAERDGQATGHEDGRGGHEDGQTGHEAEPVAESSNGARGPQRHRS